MAVSPDLAALKAVAMVPPVLPADYLLVLPVVLSMLFGAVLLCLRKRTHLHPPIALLGLGLIFAIDAAVLWQVADGGPRTMMMGAWKPPFGIAFTVDLMGALFLATAGLVALACGIYAVVSVPGTQRRFGFFPFLFLMMAGVSGAFLTGDVFNLYVWFEVLLIGSFGLMILGSEHEQLDGATKYCFLNLVGTTLFLIATGFLYGVFGTLNMADIAVKAAARPVDGVVVSIAVLYLTALCMKAAAFPLNAWLPSSYHTPRFVVSALFAGLLTKVGVYALIRILFMLFPPEQASLAPVIAWIAAATMLVGAFGALAQSDIRRLLNYFVIAGIGTILAGLSLPPLVSPPLVSTAVDTAAAMAVAAAPVTSALTLAQETGLSSAIFYALHSIVVMTALYLAAGVMVRRTGSDSLHAMGGLWRRSPGFSVLVLVLLLAASGLPPFSGFWPKLGLVRATLAGGMGWLAAVILVSGLMLTIAAARVFALAFWRPLPAGVGPDSAVADDRPRPGRFYAGLPLVVLAFVAVAAGLYPEPLAASTRAAAASVLDSAAFVRSVFGALP
ncbi:proton-conducting transporter transmembrane domain-containing protein [Aureimonas glaciei]|uniref:Cation:proton antiporter n=1 Tax=Aureimonas glaciei TaxID=1776957 RepID=A0A916Y2X7_9HYPH|nr:proton-conducting transporter membrane subunit [Aureimonas glaciei]GGD27120.1 cation:proton antiporter [Aureimonas glaciei]